MKLSGRVMAMVMIAMIVGIGFYPTALFDLVQAAVSRLP
jgi:NADH:ubiquinone oxidoreductase subunit 4 (subunit M)